MSVAPGSGRPALGLAALALSFGLACAAPASAEFFSPTEGSSDSGAPKLTVDASPFLFLSHTNATIGLDRPSGQDITINRPRPTLADVVASPDGTDRSLSVLLHGPVASFGFRF